jgi:hypothetical protein
MLENNHPRMLFFLEVMAVSSVAVSLGCAAPRFWKLRGEQ